MIGADTTVKPEMAWYVWSDKRIFDIMIVIHDKFDDVECTASTRNVGLTYS